MGCPSNMTGVLIRRRRDTGRTHREKSQEDTGPGGLPDTERGLRRSGTSSLEPQEQRQYVSAV